MRFIFFFLFYIIVNYTYGQEPSYRVIGSDTFDGIQLYSIIQDDDDTMWIATGRGLYHYDGVRFENVEMPQGVISSGLFHLTKDRNGEIYCVNLGGQIFKVSKYDEKRLEVFYTVPEEYVGSHVRFEFTKQNKLVINTHSKLYMLEEGDELRLLDDRSALLLNYKEHLYYVRYNDDLVEGKRTCEIKEIENDEAVSIIKYPTVLDVLEITQTLSVLENQFVGFDIVGNTLTKVENNRLVDLSPSFLKSGNFRCYNDGKYLWLSDYLNGVYRTSLGALNDKSVNSQPKWFKDYYVSGAYVDREESTWLLTFNKGIIIIPKTSIVNYRAQLENEKVVGVTKHDNHIYIGTKRGAIYKYENGAFSLIFEHEGQRLEYLKIFDEEDLIITATGVFQNKELVDKIPFTRDSFLWDNKLYTAEYAGLTSREFNDKGRLSPPKDLFDRDIRSYSIEEGEQEGEFYVTTSTSLEYINKDDRVETLLYEGNPINVGDLCRVGDEIWATSKNGLYIIKDKKLDRVLTEKDGLMTSRITALEYEKPYVYIASRKGVQQYNTETKEINNFTKSDGLRYGIGLFQVLNGVVYTVNGDDLISFSFNEDKQEVKTVKTRVKEAIINGDYPMLEDAVLKPRENNIEFSFLTPTYRFQKDLTYDYQLEGFEKKLIKTKNQRFVNYSNLPAGKYNFVVNSYIDGVKNSSASFPFSIRKYWYNTFAFILLIATVALLIAYSIYRTRLNALERKREREELQKRLVDSSLTSLKAQMNPHFLFNAMNSIQTLILKNNNSEAYTYLTELANLLRENLKMTDTSFVPFEDELNLIERYLELEKLRFGDTLHYEIVNKLEDYSMSIPSMIIQPFIENAIKHGLLHKKQDRRLFVEFYQAESIITCIVTDNGIGRRASEELKKKRKYKSFSTNAIQKRFNILREYYNLNVDFHYNDLKAFNESIGTRVTITIPFTEEQE